MVFDGSGMYSRIAHILSKSSRNRCEKTTFEPTKIKSKQDNSPAFFCTPRREKTLISTYLTGHFCHSKTETIDWILFFVILDCLTHKKIGARFFLFTRCRRQRNPTAGRINLAVGKYDNGANGLFTRRLERLSLWVSGDSLSTLES